MQHCRLLCRGREGPSERCWEIRMSRRRQKNLESAEHSPSCKPGSQKLVTLSSVWKELGVKRQQWNTDSPNRSATCTSSLLTRQMLTWSAQSRIFPMSKRLPWILRLQTRFSWRACFRIGGCVVQGASRLPGTPKTTANVQSHESRCPPCNSWHRSCYQTESHLVVLSTSRPGNQTESHLEARRAIFSWISARTWRSMMKARLTRVSSSPGWGPALSGQALKDLLLSIGTSTTTWPECPRWVTQQK
mmetsp:Transcript_32641/g.59903  ORF Transcript_32641/g.59903 Transcript_32641/m.59903 type:complete len:246 (+) Transcript_32641:308-1045(+)